MLLGKEWKGCCLEGFPLLCGEMERESRGLAISLGQDPSL